MSVIDDLGIALPTYRLFRYTDKVYKLVKFKRRMPYSYHLQKKAETPKYDFKLDSSISRTKRVVLELALCNSWEYFCTFTISKDKHDRSNLAAWRETFLQWIRDQRKKGIDIKYLLVPERHKDGSWHMHGLMSGVGSQLVSFEEERKKGLRVPSKLVNNGFYDWPAYREKFGFCSFAFVRNSVAVSYYTLKYITKDVAESSQAVGLHLYYANRGLNRSSLQAEIYSGSTYLDSFLENHYQFCSTGMTKVKDNLDWTFGLDYVDFAPLFEPEEAENDEKYCDTVYEVMQLTFDDYPV